MELYKVNTDAPQLFEIFLNLTRNRNPGKQVIGKKREESFLKGKPEKSYKAAVVGHISGKWGH